jgi:hypothetical protein
MTDADRYDCMRVEELLKNSPDGLTMDEIAEKSGWERWTANTVICNLGSKIGHEQVKLKNRKKAVRYYLKKGVATQ